MEKKKNTLENLDPYTNYYDEQQVEEARVRREGEYAGIGVSVNYGDKGITLIEVYKGFEADKKGLKAGDIIIKVGNQSLENARKICAALCNNLNGCVAWKLKRSDNQCSMFSSVSGYQGSSS